MIIELITINDLHNYGNRLQHYATQQFFRANGFDVENIVDESYYPMTRRGVKNRILFVLCTIKNKGYRNYLAIKQLERNFLVFNRNITYSGIHVKTSKELQENNINDRIIVVGSDQVWNPKFGVSDITLLNGVECRKKISFSSSFGVNTLPNDEKTAKCLTDFHALSVREEAGARIVNELTGREATVLVDPTMLLTKEDWRKVAKKPKGAKNGYILTYFLSEMCDDAVCKLEEIRENRTVYELLNPSDPVAGTAGPAEFLWLFDHADLILTDSFHACIFSFLFDKPFIVYDRNWSEVNMNSRLETLLTKFHIKRKYANSGLENNLWEHDYSDGYLQLEVERNKATKFIKNALEE